MQTSIHSTAFITLKTRELDDATVAYALMLFSWTTFVETAVYYWKTKIALYRVNISEMFTACAVAL